MQYLVIKIFSLIFYYFLSFLK